MVFEWDDFGANHVISDKCQSHDCRDRLDELHALNPAFKATLFTIPHEMTSELLDWCDANKSWIELAVHGFYHTSNYECEKLSYEDFSAKMAVIGPMVDMHFKKIFRAPGWQISDAALEWLYDQDWIVADQDYNTHRRAPNQRAFINRDGQFFVNKGDSEDWTPVDAYHGHVWDVGWNGIYEDAQKVDDLVKNCQEFKFVSELFV